METLERILAEHAFFEGLEPEHLKVVTGCASNVRFTPGAYVFREGEQANQFYLLRQGKVAIEIFAPQSPPIIVDTLEKDEILGWSWLVPPYRVRFDARAVGTVHAVAFDGACLRGKCETDSELGYELYRRFAVVITERLQATRMRLLDVYGDPVATVG